MDIFEFLMLGLGALLGGFVNGLAGFGTALFSLGFFLQVMTPLEAVSTTAVLAIVTGMQGLWNIRQFIKPNTGTIARFLLPALPGIPLGTTLAAQIDPAPLKFLIAVLLVVYGIFFFFRSRSSKRTSAPSPGYDYLVGFAGGTLGGLASLSGILPTMWCSLKPWEKTKIRATLQVFNFAILSLSVSLFAAQGAYTPDQIARIFLCLLIAMTGAVLGIKIFNAISTENFKRVTVTICLIVGLALFGQSLTELKRAPSLNADRPVAELMRGS